MNLADINAVMRPRRTWEAVDLGVALVRRFSGRIFCAWFATVFPLWVVVCALLWNYPGWAILVIWLTKPLVDRVPLFVMSRGLFGELPSVREVARAFPKMMVRNVFGLTIKHRMSMNAALVLPVLDLEGGRDKAMRAARIKAISRVGSGSSSLSWVFSLIETSILISLIVFGVLLIPAELLEDASWGLDALLTYADTSMIAPVLRIILVAYVAAVTLVEPFYVGGGFGIYINVRSIMEGWDIELDFRKLAERLDGEVAAVDSTTGSGRVANGNIGRSASAVVAALVLVGVVCFTQPAAASDEGWTHGDSRAAAEDVLSQPAFDVQKTKVWVSDDDEKKRDVSERSSHDFTGLIQVAFWALVAAAVGWLVYLLLVNAGKWKVGEGGGTVDDAPKIDSYLGMGVTPESLPDDVVAVARQMWDEQRFTEAMGLLYRAAIGWLVFRAHVPIEESDTEGDCVHRVDAALPDSPIAPFFKSLTIGWMAAVYAKCPPSSSEFDAWCAGWPFANKPKPKEADA